MCKPLWHTHNITKYNSFLYPACGTSNLLLGRGYVISWSTQFVEPIEKVTDYFCWCRWWFSAECVNGVTSDVKLLFAVRPNIGVSPLLLLISHLVLESVSCSTFYCNLITMCTNHSARPYIICLCMYFINTTVSILLLRHILHFAAKF